MKQRSSLFKVVKRLLQIATFSVAFTAIQIISLGNASDFYLLLCIAIIPLALYISPSQYRNITQYALFRTCASVTDSHNLAIILDKNSLHHTAEETRYLKKEAQFGLFYELKDYAIASLFALIISTVYKNAFIGLLLFKSCLIFCFVTWSYGLYCSKQLQKICATKVLDYYNQNKNAL